MKIVVLISGNGSNLEAIINAIKQGLDVQILAVISNVADAYGLMRAKQAKIPTHVIAHQAFSSRHDFDRALALQIEQYQPELIVLAGFMRRLTSKFVSHFQGKLINIHPSLLPKYPGLHTHEKALNHGDQWHGASIHFVTDKVDGGPLICQKRLLILSDDNANTLKQRVQQLEHQLYPMVLDWFAHGRLRLEEDQVLLDNQPLPKTGASL